MTTVHHPTTHRRQPFTIVAAALAVVVALWAALQLASTTERQDTPTPTPIEDVRLPGIGAEVHIPAATAGSQVAVEAGGAQAPATRPGNLGAGLIDPADIPPSVGAEWFVPPPGLYAGS